MIYLNTKFQISSTSLFFAIKPEMKYKFAVAAILFLYILQKCGLGKSHIILSSITTQGETTILYQRCVVYFI